MIIEKIISIIMTSVIFVESSVIGTPIRYETTKIEQQVSTPIVQEEIVEEIIIEEEPVVEVEEVVVPEVPKKPIVEEVKKPVNTIPQEPVTTNTTLTESEIDLIALVTMAEAEGESELGKRLVIDVILNRYDSPRFPNTINGVIYGKNAFECMWNGRIDRCYVNADIRRLVVEEINTRTNSNIHYFRANRYHSFGKPVVNVGNHYFSTY